MKDETSKNDTKPTTTELIKANQKAIIEKQLEINTAQGELNVLQNTQNALYLQQQLESLGV